VRYTAFRLALDLCAVGTIALFNGSLSAQTFPMLRHRGDCHPVVKSHCMEAGAVLSQDGTIKISLRYKDDELISANRAQLLMIFTSKDGTSMADNTLRLPWLDVGPKGSGTANCHDYVYTRAAFPAEVMNKMKDYRLEVLWSEPANEAKPQDSYTVTTTWEGRCNDKIWDSFLPPGFPTVP
jgi:hypothetical protein